MKITKRQLRQLIRESVLLEDRDFSAGLQQVRALLDAGDIKGAAELVADMNEDPHYFGGELEAIEYEHPATSDFFEDAPDEVLRRFEDLAYARLGAKVTQAVADSSHKGELAAIGKAFASGPLQPAEIKRIVYRVGTRQGQPAIVHMEDDNLATNITADEAQRRGTTLAKVIATLDSLGAKKRARRRAIKRSLPYYD